jgi:hypothetical protein
LAHEIRTLKKERAERIVPDRGKPAGIVSA